MAEQKETIYLRVSKDLGKKLKAEAADSKMSVNEYCITRLNRALDFKISDLNDEISLLLNLAFSVCGQQLKGIILFGSYVRGDNTKESDIDVLVVLDSSTKISRNLYSSWDTVSTLPSKYSIHFVNIPTSSHALSGLWCEVAMEGLVLYDAGLEVSRFLIRLREDISSGKYKAAFSHGHRYWKYIKEAA